jgi:hypothetical protein
VLFCDFDGVLHPTLARTEDGSIEPVVSTVLFGWLPALARVLRKHEDVALVIHSTWRYTHNVDELRALLGPLGSRVVGATPRGPRMDSILWWLQLSPEFSDYRILDDDLSEFPAPPPSELIVCSPSSGVSAPAVLEALRAWLDES